jgi:hypothetical protein
MENIEKRAGSKLLQLSLAFAKALHCPLPVILKLQRVHTICDAQPGKLIHLVALRD